VFPEPRCCRGSSCTHVFQTAQEVVADRGARQVRRVQAAPDVEEIVGAQHGVVLLGVARGGEDPVHQDRHLEEGVRLKRNKAWKRFLKSVKEEKRKMRPNYFTPRFLI